MDTESNILIRDLRLRLTKPLPHLDSHTKVAVSSRIRNLQSKSFKIPSHARQSAVLISLFDDNGTIRFPLILRNTYDGVHSNQIGLPGGKLESGETQSEAALREFQEELGHEVESSSLIGSLSSIYIPPSNFTLKPFISYNNVLPTFRPDTREVAEIYITSTAELMDSSIVEREIELANGKMKVKCFILQDQIVWGATAAVLSEFRDLLSEISL